MVSKPQSAATRSATTPNIAPTHPLPSNAAALPATPPDKPEAESIVAAVLEDDCCEVIVIVVPNPEAEESIAAGSDVTPLSDAVGDVVAPFSATIELEDDEELVSLKRDVG